MLVAAVALIATACGSDASVPPSTVTVTSSIVVTTAPVTQQPTAPDVPTPPLTSSAAAPASWTMPNLIGQNLQDAQDAIQALTDYEIAISTSTDLTGEGRNQMLDANWQVCSSTPPPGSTLTPSTPVDFGVVRIDVESCP
ncbi:MAG: PASTA domain-containing protein [Mycobacterium sp.]